MTVSSTRVRRLERRLLAGWAGHVRIDGKSRAWALDMLERSYPGLRGSLDVVTLNSVHRRSEVLHLAPDDHVIVLDVGYSRAVAAIASIIAAGERIPARTGEAVVSGLLGWAFFTAGDPEAASVLVAECLRRGADIMPLSQHRAPDPGAGTGLFILLHEGAHVLAASEGFDGSTHTSMVGATAKKFADAAAAMMEDIEVGRSRDGWTFGGFIPQSPDEIAHFRWQFQTYRSVVEASTDLNQEMQCDLLALCAFLDLRFGSHIVDGRYPVLPADRLREVGDVLMAGLRALRAMQTVSLLRSEAAAIVGGERIGSFSPSFAELMARQQIGTAMASNLFALLADISDARDATHSPDDYREAFSRALAGLLGPGADRPLEAVNQWLTILRDADAWDSLRTSGLPDIERFSSNVGIEGNDQTSIALDLMERLPF